MAENLKANPAEFADYMQSFVKLNALEKMTQELDKELSDSQNMMKEIKAIYESIPDGQNNCQPMDSGVRHEEISKFIEDCVPRMLLPDMKENTMDYHIDEVIATVKTYAEDLKKNFTVAQAKVNYNKEKEFTPLDLEQYANCFDQLCKRLDSIKLNNKDILDKRNVELEGKLTQLCDDVNQFTTMVMAKRALSESNKNWEQIDSNALQYANMINKLLSGINEVAYLMKNKN